MRESTTRNPESAPPERDSIVARAEFRPAAHGVGAAARRQQRRLTFSLALLCTVWIAAVAAGFAVVHDYGTRPGDPGQAAPVAPHQLLALAADRPTLILFAHPNCPCTRASMSRLERIATECGDRLAVHALFVPPHGDCAAARESAVWRAAAAIPGVDIHCDPDGMISRGYGAATSGQVMLFDARGALAFAGGITPSRGHDGDNAGAGAIVSFVLDGAAPTASAAVYGCALFDEDSNCTAECAR
jgi:hypothetical protein